MALGGLHRLDNFSLSGTESSFAVDLKGAFYGLDDYLAIPSSPRDRFPTKSLLLRHSTKWPTPPASDPSGWPSPRTGTSWSLPTTVRTTSISEAMGCSHGAAVDRFHESIHRLLGAPPIRPRTKPIDCDVCRRWRAVVDQESGLPPTGALPTDDSTGEQ